jgi:hypothetical protein
MGETNMPNNTRYAKQKLLAAARDSYSRGYALGVNGGLRAFNGPQDLTVMELQAYDRGYAAGCKVRAEMFAKALQKAVQKAGPITRDRVLDLDNKT